jgi:hypothetical protein
MPTVSEVIRRVLPQGTNPAPEGEPVLVDWSVPPLWPPDLFALAATLVRLSGAYAHASVTGSTAKSAGPSATYPDRVEGVGDAWRTLEPAKLPQVMEHLQRLWDVLVAAGWRQVSEYLRPDSHAWCSAALELMAIADVASAGIGFDVEVSPIFSQEVAGRHFGPVARAVASLEAQRTTATLCKLVPPEECCVQPKSRTPQVGCTLRSLSHHLALLPPLCEVTTSYLRTTKPISTDELNLLLVPFPYYLPPDALVKGVVHAGEGWGRFSIAQRWFPPGDAASSGEALARFLGELVAEAKRHGAVHGIVLPELALDRDRARVVASSLSKTGISLFVTGVLSPGAVGCPPRNSVMSVLYEGEEVQTDWEQSKHHRWRLDRSQIERYGAPLERDLLWWEDIDVSNRHVRFTAFLDGATLAALVCEDLARIDPVQPVLRAVGPNLVIALLMDGPQHEHRWPGRYATVLAEDPGSSVLTVTSAGLVDLHRDPQHDPVRAIGLWKDASTPATKLLLPQGDHALFLRIGITAVEERTMDRRTDGGATRELRRRDHTSIRHPSPPAWLNATS